MRALDYDLLFSDDQAITDSANSTNDIDTKVANRGTGNPKGLYVQVTEDFADSVAGQLTVVLQDSADGSSFADCMSLEPVARAKAALPAGTVIFDGWLPKDHRRYLRLRYVVANGPFTGGAIKAGLC